MIFIGLFVIVLIMCIMIPSINKFLIYLITLGVSAAFGVIAIVWLALFKILDVSVYTFRSNILNCVRQKVKSLTGRYKQN